MSTLSDVRLLEKIYDHELIIDPLILDNIQPSSIDLTLGTEIKVPNCFLKEINVYENVDEYFETKSTNGYTLKPGAFILGQINETIGFSRNTHGTIQNRNSLIRMGINVGLSTYINPGYKGKLTIAIHNIGNFNLKLVAGMRICQLVVNDVKPESREGYHQKIDAKYYNEQEIELPKVYLDKEYKEYLELTKEGPFSIEELSSFLLKRIRRNSSILEELSDEEKLKIGLK